MFVMITSALNWRNPVRQILVFLCRTVPDEENNSEYVLYAGQEHAHKCAKVRLQGTIINPLPTPVQL